ncbi:MAG: ankyrin repeat domain-containing protein [Gemmataceae bacterium]|nr:ankyrin repeat domain-containing protein [Gemmataceae bacterium]
MSDPISRRTFTTLSAGFVLGSAADLRADEPKKAEPPKPTAGPVEAAFERDYPAPAFKPAWKNPQLNRVLVQDFVVFAHSDLDMTKKLAEKYPAVLNGAMDWGNGDWETGLGGASHMGRHDIVEFLLEKGARIDLFCAAMMGQLDAVKSFLTLQPKLIDAKGPHGFTLHFHAQLARDGGKVLDYLQSVKKVELKPNPFLKKP